MMCLRCTHGVLCLQTARPGPLPCRRGIASRPLPRIRDHLALRAGDLLLQLLVERGCMLAPLVAGVKDLAAIPQDARV